MIKSADDDFVTLDDLALELLVGGRTRANPLGLPPAKRGPPTREEAQAFLNQALDQKNPHFTGWKNVGETMKNKHCVNEITRRAYNIINRIQ